MSKVVTLLEACHVTGALTNQRRVLAPAARRTSAICPANDTSGATYLMISHVSSTLWTLLLFTEKKDILCHSYIKKS